MYQFCTISTVSHLYKVYALADSLKNQQRDFLLNVLVIDDDGSFEFENCRFFKLSAISLQQHANDITTKYHKNKDKLRWSLKPVLMKYLLSKPEIDLPKEMLKYPPTRLSCNVVIFIAFSKQFYLGLVLKQIRN